MDTAEVVAVVGAGVAAVMANKAQTTANQALALAQTAPDAAEAAAIAAAAAQSAADANAAKVSSVVISLGGAGLAAPGPVALVGADVGAHVVCVTANGLLANTDFEGVITVQDQIQQTGGAHLAASLIVFLQGP